MIINYDFFLIELALIGIVVVTSSVRVEFPVNGVTTTVLRRMRFRFCLKLPSANDLPRL